MRRVGVLLLACSLAAESSATAASPAVPAVGKRGKPIRFEPRIPKTWDEAALRTLELPLANPGLSPVHVSADYYERIPVLTVYKTYPVYAPGREPDGYFDALARMEPEVAFDAAHLRSKADWIRAGEIVFDAPIDFDLTNNVQDVRDPAWYERLRMPVDRRGILPFYRYVIRQKGKVELGNLACGNCHTRVAADGTVLKGAQGNFPFDEAQGLLIRTRVPEESARASSRLLYGAPWVRPNPDAAWDQMSREEIAEALEAAPPGVHARQGTNPFHTVRIPDLYGLKERRYLDATGLVRHRSIGDLMRYAALNQGLDFASRYGDWVPAAEGGKLPEPEKYLSVRYSDEQLYALSLYLYALRPPPNPNRFDALAARGRRVFDREGCGGCHRPPLYSSNKLTVASGYEPGPAHRSEPDLFPISVGTDPGLATRTRRGTGLYKVPSLRGVWCRGPLSHDGSVATLEDWFDPRRLRDDYVPTGFKGWRVTTRAVKGHPFGLALSPDEKRALLAFLRTL